MATHRLCMLALALVAVACEKRNEAPSAKPVSSVELDAGPAKVDVCVESDFRTESAHYRSIGLTKERDLAFCITETSCIQYELEAGKAVRRTPGTSGTFSLETPRKRAQASAMVDGVEVCPLAGPCRTLSVANARPPHEKSGNAGTPISVDDDGTLLAVDMPKETLVYDVKTAKVVHRFEHASATSFCDSTCFFGSSLYCASTRGVAFVDARTGAFVAHLGGSPSSKMSCPARLPWLDTYLPRRSALPLEGGLWGFVLDDGSVVLEDVVSHKVAKTIPIESLGDAGLAPSLPMLFEGARKRLLVALQGRALGDLVVIDWTTGNVQRRFSLPTCAPPKQ